MQIISSWQLVVHGRHQREWAKSRSLDDPQSLATFTGRGGGEIILSSGMPLVRTSKPWLLTGSHWRQSNGFR
jgi:hypothetical protein